MTLLEECLIALGSYCERHDNEAEEFFDLLTERFPFTCWGRIDWAVMQRKEEAQDVESALAHIATDKCLILWDIGSLPVVEARIEDVIRNIDDVTAVSFDTWIVDPSFNVVVEFYHEGEIVVGFCDADASTIHR